MSEKESQFKPSNLTLHEMMEENGMVLGSDGKYHPPDGYPGDEGIGVRGEIILGEGIGVRGECKYCGDTLYASSQVVSAIGAFDDPRTACDLKYLYKGDNYNGNTNTLSEIEMAVTDRRLFPHQRDEAQRKMHKRIYGVLTPNQNACIKGFCNHSCAKRYFRRVGIVWTIAIIIAITTILFLLLAF